MCAHLVGCFMAFLWTVCRDDDPMTHQPLNHVGKCDKHPGIRKNGDTATKEDMRTGLFFVETLVVVPNRLRSCCWPLYHNISQHTDICNQADQAGDQPVFVQLFSGLPRSLPIIPSAPPESVISRTASHCPWESVKCVQRWR